MEYIKAFLKGFFKGLNPLTWTEKDIVPFIVLFLLGFFFQDIKELVLSLFN